jgi:hypothetical protein
MVNFEIAIDHFLRVGMVCRQCIFHMHQVEY